MSILRQYFRLQLSMTKRHLVEFGLAPATGFIIITAAFYGFSAYLFHAVKFANYCYVLVAVSLLLPYTEMNRNDFLKLVYPKKNYLVIRVAENLITVAAFILFLCSRREYYPALILLVLAVLAIFTGSGKKPLMAIPTPFYKKPFEFIVGFRRSFPVLIAAWALGVIAIIYQNDNLGLFALALVFLACIGFYLEPENVFYVWVHKLNYNQFLLDKIITALIFSTLLALPVSIALIIFFKASMPAIIGLQVLGYCYLLTIILAKYAAYPNRINLPQAILFTFSLAMPPLLLALVPFFYLQSVKRLKEILP